MITEKKYRIAGHESFPCRYAWLPKTVRYLQSNPRLFSDEEQAMVDLGLGKNMVRSSRFWAQATGTISAVSNGYRISDFGSTLFGEQGLDRFLEDIRTLWLIHWNLSTNVANPLLAWDFVFNRWNEPEIVRGAILRALVQEAAKHGGEISRVTLEQHLDTFLHTYFPTSAKKGRVQEDNLDCPLIELGLIQKVGERKSNEGMEEWETIYALDRDDKPQITPEIFVYCICDFWEKYHPSESTLTLREFAHGHGSPGQIFKIPEMDIRARLESLKEQTSGILEYVESAQIEQIRRNGKRETIELLKEIYQ